VVESSPELFPEIINFDTTMINFNGAVGRYGFTCMATNNLSGRPSCKSAAPPEVRRPKHTDTDTLYLFAVWRCISIARSCLVITSLSQFAAFCRLEIQTEVSQTQLVCTTIEDQPGQ